MKAAPANKSAACAPAHAAKTNAKASAPNGGRPLGKSARASLEPLFGVDFSRVRIHDDAASARGARGLGASAFTLGQNVYFDSGRYQPHNPDGKRLLVHELAHTAQQQHAPDASPSHVELRSPGDVHEREAEVAAERVMIGHHAPRISPVGSQTLQRSILGAIGDVLAAPFVALYRLFGGESYNLETLQDYLREIRGTGKIEDNFDSDNKARACVSRESELGAFDVATKALLIREMLNGATLWADEASIIKLIRDTRPPEREQLVQAVGRALILDNFSFGNYRVVEAMMLTAAEAKGAGFVDRFRSMGDGDFKDYLGNALDPDVRQELLKIQTLRAAQKNITARLPGDAKIDAQGVATTQINGTDVVIRPDTVDPTMGRGAVTAFGLLWQPPTDITVNAETRVIASFTAPRLTATLQTTYGPDVDKSGASGYGRGTTKDDQQAGNTSVRFHEGEHGADWLKYLGDHALPVFRGTVGMAEKEFDALTVQFNQEIAKYNADATKASFLRTDCVGVPIPEEHARRVGLSAAQCHPH